MKPWLLAGIPPLAVLVLYARTVAYGFVWDDKLFTALPIYRSSDLFRVLTSAANGFEYLPVRDLSLMVDYRLFGAWQGGFHLVNVLLFALASVLVFWFYWLVFAAAREPAAGRYAGLLALLGALAFCLHPLQVECVAFVTQRNALLALCFSVASILAYAGSLRLGALPRSRWLYGLSLALLLAALFSKASAISLCLLVLLLHLYLVPGDSLRRALWRLLPHFAATLLALGLHLWIARSAELLQSSLSPLAWAMRLPRMLFAAAFYAYKALWPAELLMEYDLQAYLDRPLWMGAWTFVVCAALLALVIAGRRRLSLAWLLAWGYVLALIPVSNLLPTHQTVADRYAQLPMLFLVPLVFTLLYALMERIGSRLGGSRSAVAVTLAALGIALLGWKTWQQVPVWADAESLYRHTIERNPRAEKALANLGLHLHQQKRSQEALVLYAQLAELDPSDFRYSYLRGLLAFQQRRLQEAERYLLEAVELEGDTRYVADIALAELHVERGDRQAALERFEHAGSLARRSAFAGRELRYIEQRLRELERSLGRF